MFRFRINTILIQIIGWLLFLLLPVLFLNSGHKGGAWILLSSPYYWLFVITYLLLFYFNLWFLIPRFFLKKRYIDYGIGVMVLLSCVYFLQPFDKLLAHNPRFQTQMEPAGPPLTDTAAIQPVTGTLPNGPKNSLPFGPLPHQDMRMQDPNKREGHNPLWEHSRSVDVVSLVLFFMITAFSLSVRTVEQWQATEKQVAVAEAEKATAELSFLKAQINPHFLFNTLNNIYTLSVMNSEHTSASIMKLSNIMRYVTDDVTNDFVPLQNDLACIQDFVDLQRLRLGRKTQVDLLINGAVNQQKIAPLILMSFVENAFKYGISKQENSIIKIEVNVDGPQIRFCCQNGIFDNKSSVIERTGIGIANTKQRLQHLYPGKHQLTINNSHQTFTVKLTLDA